MSKFKRKAEEQLKQGYIYTLFIQRAKLTNYSAQKAKEKGLIFRSELVDKGVPTEELESKVAKYVEELTAVYVANAEISESEKKGIEAALKGLKKMGVSPEEIETLVAEYSESKMIAKAQTTLRDSAKYTDSKGYKEGNALSAQVYVLECSHQIRASKRAGLISKGLLGKMVLCETCGAKRKVTSAPSWVR